VLLVIGLSSLPSVLIKARLASRTPPWILSRLADSDEALGASARVAYGRGLPSAGLTEGARVAEAIEGSLVGLR